VVDGELDWREWTDQAMNRREAVVLRARQILFEGPRSTPQTGADQRDGDVSPNLESGVAAAAVSAPGPDDVPF
jgi:single-stranded DNA-binding protein